MPNATDLRQFLLNDFHALEAAPDAINVMSPNTTTFLWNDVAMLGGALYGVGCNLHSGPALGGVWLYGNGLRGVALHPNREPRIPMLTRPHLLRLLQQHLAAHQYQQEQDQWLQAFMGMDPFG